MFRSVMAPAAGAAGIMADSRQLRNDTVALRFSTC